MQSLQGKVVLITGAGGGFGQAMIRQFLQAGSRLVLADRTLALSVVAAERIAARPGPAPLTGKILGFIAADLADPAGSAALYRQCMAITPAIDLLVNNAGVAVVGLLPDVPARRWEELMQVNLLAPMRLTALFLPGMIARHSGHIANVSSVAGLIGVPGLSSYCAAKFGLRGFGEALAADLAPYGIGVTTIYPFFARTSILHAERFGADAPPLPRRLIYDPEFVVAALITGIRQGRRHVYPGMIPRQLDLLQRLAPWVLPRLIRANWSRRAPSAPPR